ncbi:hypothetical protein [Oceanirhabdus sp. W0125-5]|uniref:hypothetical protein n=1 Tax=Oceanirhabdus sp. W0125-5 TaxID=2999116 RepID=UPI0022F2DA29|nr:hypothetical protein [Oceanirhabdus sp. W0125-5]WBW98105.1 hypothetical protein OW730_04890 [Oceanirhabdus sp. W0125-5]
MKILIILMMLNSICITIDFSRLLLSILLGFKPTNFGIFLGPRMFPFKVKDIEVSFSIIPIGSYIQFDPDNFYNSNKIKQQFLRYYGNVMELIALLIIHIFFKQNYILNKVALLILIGFIISFSINLKNTFKPQNASNNSLNNEALKN